ncbi:uncharacterized protein LOC128885931 [Hylaeus anthracinus]|uniref:uncharacterized protein LOC128874054 n=1 Tax=Hylaeus volcanicus TaxID=313075 RepID=UPI0023B7D978|nr:uncharacterized protein LOC128874054 [Hylaeus volcanicus]XP_053996298.1 uncharacterized protein LOC128885931 [Hylaeus anthracinus]
MSLNLKMDVVKRKRNLRKRKEQISNKSEVESRNESRSSIKWSNRDKRILLEALKKYGSENITAISNTLLHIPPEAIKSKIAEYSGMAEELQENELLNNWLNCGSYKPGDSLIPEALLFIQLFENHPSPSEVEGYDFKAIYKFLYHSCLEQTSFFDLSRKDRNMLCSSLSKVENKSWPKCQKELWEYVGRAYNRINIKKVYPGKNVHSW